MRQDRDNGGNRGRKSQEGAPFAFDGDFWALCLVVGIVVWLSGCSTVPYTGRQQLLMVSQGQEISLGYQAFEQVKRQSRPARDPRLHEVTQRVGERLARAADRPDFRWEFVVLEHPQANAFCLPGGKVGVYSGLFKHIQSDTDLATVISHETAHVLARHAGERLSQSQLAQLGGLGLGMAMMGAGPAAGQTAMLGYNLGTQYGVLLPYNRKQEYEADRIGMILMAKAGYDPAQAVDFWRRFAYAKRDKMAMPAFLSSHPSDGDRIRAMEASLVEARRYFQPQLANQTRPEMPQPASRWQRHENRPVKP
ncbi:MAG: M48 family metallopeptidase [Deltaproteobacteria bacterium]|nr:M48 family metallopeptidase [Deltaproteobacteria bacterium]